MEIRNIQEAYHHVSAQDTSQIEERKNQASKAAILKSAADTVAPLVYAAPTAEPAVGTASWNYWAKSQVYMIMSELFEVASKIPIDTQKMMELSRQLGTYKGKLGPEMDKRINQARSAALDPGVYIMDYSKTFATKWIMPFLQQPGLSDYLSGGEYNKMNPLMTIVTALAGCHSTFKSIDKTFWGRQEISYFMPIYLMNFAFAKAGGNPTKAKEIYQQFVKEMPKPVGNSVMYKAAYEKAQAMLKNFPTSWSNNDYANIQMKLALQDFIQNL